jgi:hypothetical protein
MNQEKKLKEAAFEIAKQMMIEELESCPKPRSPELVNKVRNKIKNWEMPS